MVVFFFSPYNHCWWKTTPIVKKTTPGETPFKLGWKRDFVGRQWSGHGLDWLVDGQTLCAKFRLKWLKPSDVGRLCWLLYLTFVSKVRRQGTPLSSTRNAWQKPQKTKKQMIIIPPIFLTSALKCSEPWLTCLELQNPTTQHRNFVAKHVFEVNEASWLWQFRHSDRRLLFTREFLLDAPKKVICKNSNIESI